MDAWRVQSAVTGGERTRNRGENSTIAVLKRTRLFREAEKLFSIVKVS